MHPSLPCISFKSLCSFLISPALSSSSANSREPQEHPALLVRSLQVARDARACARARACERVRVSVERSWYGLIYGCLSWCGQELVAKESRFVEELCSKRAAS